MILQDFDKFKETPPDPYKSSMLPYYRFTNGRQMQKAFQYAFPQIAGSFKIIYKNSSGIIYIYKARHDKLEELIVRYGLDIDTKDMLKIINFIL